MAVTADRTTILTYSGNTMATESFSAAQNTASPGSITIHTLSSGANTITVPTGGSTVVCATIVPPSGNTQTITLKGVTGDTGVAIHKTDPSSVALDSVTSFVLTAGGTVTGLRIHWS